jgi:hypothetical protein
VATWVEAFTDAVFGRPQAVEMPQVLLLDSTSFYRIRLSRHSTLAMQAGIGASFRAGARVGLPAACPKSCADARADGVRRTGSTSGGSFSGDALLVA